METSRESDNRENLKYQTYIDERKSLFNAALDQTHLFDKAILTLASGALGLSLTFIRQIIPEGCEPKYILTLIFSWIFFSLSIISTVLSFLTSVKACTKQIEILEIEFFNKINGESKDRKNFYRKITSFFNVCSIIFFIIGIFLLARFSILNLK